MTFELTPPEDKANTKHFQFRALIVAFYQWKWKDECPWDGSEARQLSSLLKSCPKLDIATFKRWLYNYGCSDDIKPGERPRSFLPKIHNYSVVPLDRFGRSQDVQIDTAQTQRLKRGFANLERPVSPRLPENSIDDLPEQRIIRGRDRQLGSGFKPLSGFGD